MQEDIISIKAPLDANVWKVQVKEASSADDTRGDKEEETKKSSVEMGDEVFVLEAMKLEVAVKYGIGQEGEVLDNGKRVAKVEKILVKPGETVKAGQNLCLLRLTT